MKKIYVFGDLGRKSVYRDEKRKRWKNFFFNKNYYFCCYNNKTSIVDILLIAFAIYSVTQNLANSRV